MVQRRSDGYCGWKNGKLCQVKYYEDWDVEDLSIQTLEVLTVEEVKALKKTKKMFRKLYYDQRLLTEHSGIQAKTNLSRRCYAWKLSFLSELTENDKKLQIYFVIKICS